MQKPLTFLKEDLSSFFGFIKIFTALFEFLRHPFLNIYALILRLLFILIKKQTIYFMQEVRKDIETNIFVSDKQKKTK